MCEEFLIKCPFACFAQVCPRKTRCSGWGSRFLAGIQRVPVSPWRNTPFLSVWAECRGQSQVLGGMLPQSKAFSHFLSAWRLHILQEAAAQSPRCSAEPDLSSAPCSEFCNCRSTRFSPFLGDFFFFLEVC